MKRFKQITFHNKPYSVAGWQRLMIVCLLTLTIAPIFAQRTDRLDLAVRRARYIPDMQHAAISVCVRDVDNDSIIYASDAERSMPPASINKLITAAVAYNLLGSNYRFQTIIEYSGYIDASRKILHGDIFIRGNGDPLMGSLRYRQVLPDSLFVDMLKLIQYEGIKHVSGKVYVDATAYRDEAVHPSWRWGDIGNYYCAGANAINFCENMLCVHIAAGAKVGDSARILSVGPIVPIVNEVITSEPDASGGISFYGGPSEYRRICRGTIPLGTKDTLVYASLPNPGLIMARDLTYFLRQQGISVNGEAAMWNAHQRKPSTRAFSNKYVSHSLSTIVDHAMFDKYSTVAESIFKHLGLTQVHDGSYVGGSKAIHQYFKKKGLDDSNVCLVDGSGISSDNRITAEFICNFLDTIASDANWDALYNGWTNTVITGDKGFQIPRAPHRCVLKYKIGSQRGVQNIVGYFINRKGVTYSFAILCNDYSGDSANNFSVLSSIMTEIVRL